MIILNEIEHVGSKFTIWINSKGLRFKLENLLKEDEVIIENKPIAFILAIRLCLENPNGDNFGFSVCGVDNLGKFSLDGRFSARPDDTKWKGLFVKVTRYPFGGGRKRNIVQYHQHAIALYERDLKRILETLEDYF